VRRWALAPGAWLEILAALDSGWSPSARALVVARVRGLSDEPYAIEAISKVLALLAPDFVPLMPAPARAFVLGDDAPADAESLARMIDWFAPAVAENRAELEAIGRAHAYRPGQVLDRLLWFDSEGHRHFG
jgi:hypothetical protein